MKIHSSSAIPICGTAIAVLMSLAVPSPAAPDPSQVEDRVDDILAQMTLDEKLAYISGVGFDPTFQNQIGVFNIKGDARLSEALGRPVTLGLPEIYGVDGSAGFVGQGFPAGTRLPAGQLLASTWNPDRAYEIGVALGQETRSRGAHRILGPASNT